MSRLIDDVLLVTYYKDLGTGLVSHALNVMHHVLSMTCYWWLNKLLGTKDLWVTPYTLFVTSYRWRVGDLIWGFGDKGLVSHALYVMCHVLSMTCFLWLISIWWQKTCESCIFVIWHVLPMTCYLWLIIFTFSKGKGTFERTLLLSSPHSFSTFSYTLFKPMKNLSIYKLFLR